MHLIYTYQFTIIFFLYKWLYYNNFTCIRGICSTWQAFWCLYNTTKIPFIFISMEIFSHFFDVFIQYYKIVVLLFYYHTFNIALSGVLYQNLPKKLRRIIFWDIQTNWHLASGVRPMSMQNVFHLQDIKAIFHVLKICQRLAKFQEPKVGHKLNELAFFFTSFTRTNHHFNNSIFTPASPQLLILGTLTINRHEILPHIKPKMCNLALPLTCMLFVNYQT